MYPSDLQTIAGGIINSNFAVLNKYFPDDFPVNDHASSLHQSSNGELHIECVAPEQASSSHWFKKARQKTSFKILDQSHTMHLNAKLVIDIPSQLTTIRIKAKRKKIDLEFSQLIMASQPTLVPIKPIPVRVQYFPLVSEAEFLAKYPDISAANYPELLLRFRVLSEEPSEQLEWIITEFERRYAISPNIRTKTYLQLALQVQEYFTPYTLTMLIRLLYATKDKVDIATECQQLLERLKRHLIRFNIIYPQSPNGCVSLMLQLIALLSSDSKKLIDACLDQYVAENYERFKMNDEEDTEFSHCSEIAALTLAVQRIINTLIHFGKFFEHEFNDCGDIFATIATKYYLRLREDAEKLKLIPSHEVTDLHVRLCTLHRLVTSCGLVTSDKLISMEELFNAYLFDYLDCLGIRMKEIVREAVAQDSFTPLSAECQRSYSFRNIFSFIKYATQELSQFQIPKRHHQITFIALVDEALDLYARKLQKKGLVFLANIPSSSLQDPVDVLGYLDTSGLSVLIHNVLGLEPKLQSLANNFKEEDSEVDYNLIALNHTSTSIITEWISTVLKKLPVNQILADYFSSKEQTDTDFLIITINSWLERIPVPNIPDSVVMEMFEHLFALIIAWIEEQVMHQHLSLAQIAAFQKEAEPRLINLFHGNGVGISIAVLTAHCQLLHQLTEAADCSMEQNVIVGNYKSAASHGLKTFFGLPNTSSASSTETELPTRLLATSSVRIKPDNL